MSIPSVGAFIAAHAVAFDMDGTLVDSTAVVEALWTEFAQRHGLDVGAVIAFAHGRVPVDTLRRFLPEASDDAHHEMAREFVESEVSRTRGIVEIPGAAALVAGLADAGTPTALVTSATRDLAVARMAAAGIRMPEVVVTADDVARGKPAPDGYLIALGRMGVRADDAVVFEDADAGVRAAFAAGVRVVVVGAPGAATPRGGWHVPSLDIVEVAKGGLRIASAE